MKTVTGKTSAWLTSGNPNEDSSKFDNLFLTTGDMTSSGWVKVGSAAVTVDLFDDTSIIAGQINMLHEAERRVMAESEKKLTEIRGQIQSLLAIECKPEVMA